LDKIQPLQRTASFSRQAVDLGGYTGGESPLVVRLPRQAGQKEVRYAHLLAGGVAAAEAEEQPETEPELDRIAKLEIEVENL